MPLQRHGYQQTLNKTAEPSHSGIVKVVPPKQRASLESGQPVDHSLLQHHQLDSKSRQSSPLRVQIAAALRACVDKSLEASSAPFAACIGKGALMLALARASMLHAKCVLKGSQLCNCCTLLPTYRHVLEVCTVVIALVQVLDTQVWEQQQSKELDGETQ